MIKRTEHEQAVSLRREGKTYHEIRQRFGIAKSTLWRWLKAEGLVNTQLQRRTELSRLAQRRAVIAIRAKRLARTLAVMEPARKQVGGLSPRHLWLIGVALYWAEGAKQKPHNIAQGVVFSNTDPAMLRIFLAWLRDVCHISSEDLAFEIYIHESANIESARQFWASTLQIPAERFRIRLKRHNPSPRRRNIGEHYAGLVRISVPKSAQLNRRITGWVEGIVQSLGESANGRPPEFGSGYPGSNPGSPAMFDDLVLLDGEPRTTLHDLPLLTDGPSVTDDWLVDQGARRTP